MIWSMNMPRSAFLNQEPSTQGVDELRAQQIQSIVDTDKSLKHPDSSGGPEDPSTSGGHLGAGSFLQPDTQTVPKPSAENLVQLNPSSSLDFKSRLSA